MNNEEKILELLQTQNTQITKISEDLSSVKTDVADLKTDVADLKTRVAKIEITQENVILPQLQLLSEGIISVNDKLISRSEFDAVKEEVAFLRDIVRMHTTQLNDLQKAQ